MESALNTQPGRLVLNDGVAMKEGRAPSPPTAAMAEPPRTGPEEPAPPTRVALDGRSYTTENTR